MSLTIGQAARAVVALEATTAALRAYLDAAVRTKYGEDECVSTLHLPGIKVTPSLSHEGIKIVDPAAYLAWVTARHPHAIETITRVRDLDSKAIRAALMTVDASVAGPDGEEIPVVLVVDAEGEIVPGLAHDPGGELRSVSLVADAPTKRRVAQVAEEIVNGDRRLALPGMPDVAA